MPLVFRSAHRSRSLRLVSAAMFLCFAILPWSANGNVPRATANGEGSGGTDNSPIGVAQSASPPPGGNIDTAAGQPVDQIGADQIKSGEYDVVLRYILPAVISLLGVIGVIIFSRRNLIADHWLKTNALEIEHIQSRLDRLWGPYLVMSDSHHLFAQDIRARQDDLQNYRMLKALFDKEWLGKLSPGDRQLVRDVCENGDRLSKLIIENSGMVEFKLLPFLSRALAHWRVLKLAAEGKLGDDPAPFLRYIYPRSLDEAVHREVLRLTGRLVLLRSAPSKPHGQIAALDLSGLELDAWPDPSRPRFVEGVGLVPDPVKSKSLWASLNEIDASPMAHTNSAD